MIKIKTESMTPDQIVDVCKALMNLRVRYVYTDLDSDA